MRYPSLTQVDRLSLLRILRSSGIGAVQFFKYWQKTGGDAGAILQMLGGKAASDTACRKEMEQAQKLGAKLIAYGEADYPEGLTEIYDAPPLMMALGNAALLRARPMVAIVGARNASVAGKAFARQIAEGLAASGVTVVSGFARGVDGAAHAGAMNGRTVGVFGVGIDCTYPDQHKELRQEMLAKGNCFVSELPFGTGPLAKNFPARNRIIAAMSDAVVVIEASLQSGSLITANMALEMGKEIFAVPGFPTDSRHHGANHLIKHGANLLESHQEILDFLANRRVSVPMVQAAAMSPPAANDGAADTVRGAILGALSSTPVSIDELAKACQLSIPATVAELIKLELDGQIERLPGQRVMRAGR
ncbi:DNA-protecting protein DprA [bacterium]|nr:DNA-protecting protein DprA [bacterium]